MRLIDADALMNELKKAIEESHNERMAFIDYNFETLICDADTIDPVRHGKWIGKPLAGYATVRCSSCSDVYLENSGRWNYCPNCGAKMDKED